MMLVVLLLAGAARAAGDDVAALLARAESLRGQKQFSEAIVLLRQARAQNPSSTRVALLLAETLGWNRQFREAEQVYREILRVDPQSHDAASGLARILLWQRRYADARAQYLELARGGTRSDLDAAEGAATAAYWAGDWVTAQQEFTAVLRSDPQRQTARESLAGIVAATRAEQFATTEAIDDDQPLRSVHLEVGETFHSDALTRWSVAAGGYVFSDHEADQRWSAPSIRVSNQKSLPWERLRIDSSLGLLRYGDGSTRILGGGALRRFFRAHEEIVASIERRELVATATARTFHPAVTTFGAGWHRDGDRESILAAVDAGALRYDDHNRGWFAQGYGLFPLVHRGRFLLAGGASMAARNTTESRFYVETVGSTRGADALYRYEYSGSYTPYWSPRQLREGRAIVQAVVDVGRASRLTLHADGGTARDLAEAFGPASGRTPFPTAITTFDFHRTFHPWRLSATYSAQLNDSLRVDLGVESSATAFYRARTFRATVARRR